MLSRVLVVLMLFGSAPALAVETLSGSTLPDLMKQQSYASAWNAMLARETIPEWVANFGVTLDGPPIPAIDVPLLGETYMLAFTCKPNDCASNQVYVLFAPAARDAWGMLIDAGKVRWLGGPDPTIQKAILSRVE